MSEQALELRIEVLVVGNTVKIVSLRHPFDVQDRDGYSQRIVCEHGGRDSFRRANYSAGHAETALELFAEPFEELDVFCLFACKLQQRTRAIIFRQCLPRVVDDEGQNELFDQAKDGQICVTTDLVQQSLFVFAQKCERFDAARDSGINGFVKSSCLSPPMMSSIRQLTRREAASAA